MMFISVLFLLMMMGCAVSSFAEDEAPEGKETEGDKPKGGDPPIPTGDTWDAVLNKMPPPHKKLYESHLEQHTSGLKKALDSERDSRKSLEKTLKEIESELGDGKPKEAISKLRTDLETERRDNAFLTSVSGQVSNVKHARAIAEAEGLIEKDGTVDIEKLKTAAPALFSKQGDGRPGAGTGQVPDKPKTMDDLIRQNRKR